MTLPTAYLDQFNEPAGFVDFASVGPMSRRAAAAVSDLVGTLQRGDQPIGPLFETLLADGAAAAARLVGVDPGHAVLTASTGSALFHVALGLRGGNVVVPAGEFPANLYPWLRAEEAGLIDEVRMVPLRDGRATPEAFRPAVDGATAAIAVSLVDYLTGFRADLGALSQMSSGALLVVDGIQAVGAVPVSLAPADVLVAGGQKWLRAGMGAALMAVSDRALDRLAPTLSGWIATRDPFMFELPPPHPLLDGAGRYQISAPPVLGAAGLIAAVEVLEMAGIETISPTVLERAAALEEAVRAAGAEVLTPWRSTEERAGIVSFRHRTEPPGDTLERLGSAGITASVRAGWVRFSPHATTSPAVGAIVGEVIGR